MGNNALPLCGPIRVSSYNPYWHSGVHNNIPCAQATEHWTGSFGGASTVADEGWRDLSFDSTSTIRPRSPGWQRFSNGLL
jgi:hypothetical protein